MLQAHINELKKQKRKQLGVALILGLLIVLAVLLSINVGTIKLNPVEVVQTLMGQGTAKQHMILFDFRLPRIVISILIGAGLAVSGCILQGVARNPLADPGILGINAGAGLMVMLYVFYTNAGASNSLFILPMMAMIGAGLTAILLYLLAYKKGEGISPIRLILSGIGASAGISSLMNMITIKFNPDQYQFVATWLAGSIWGSNWKFVLALLPWVIVFIPLAWWKSQSLNLLSLTEPMATGLGLSVQKERVKLLVIAVCLAAACVSVSGGIGFIGLIGPHLARRLVGSKHQILIPVSALLGALLVVVADILARSIIPHTEIPTGTVVAIIGAPYFIYLMIKSK